MLLLHHDEKQAKFTLEEAGWGTVQLRAYFRADSLWWGEGCAATGACFTYSSKAGAMRGLKREEERGFQELTGGEWNEDPPCLAALHGPLLIKGSFAQNQGAHTHCRCEKQGRGKAEIAKGNGRLRKGPPREPLGCSMEAPAPSAKNPGQDPEKGWVEHSLACRWRKLGTSPIALEDKVCGRQGRWDRSGPWLLFPLLWQGWCPRREWVWGGWEAGT